MTIIEKYRHNDKLLHFIINSYPHCECIDKIEGKIIQGEYSGYQIKDNKTGIAYFVEDGIRGIEYGSFYIKNGIPRRIPDPLDELQIRHLAEVFEKKFNEEGIEVPKFISHLRRPSQQDWFKEYWVSKFID